MLLCFLVLCVRAHLLGVSFSSPTSQPFLPSPVAAPARTSAQPPSTLSSPSLLFDLQKISLAQLETSVPLLKMAIQRGESPVDAIAFPDEGEFVV
jgi:hypothetical protein